MQSLDRRARKLQARSSRPRLATAEAEYASALTRIARHIGHLVDAYQTPDAHLTELTALLGAYSKALKPWAMKTALRMIQEVDRRDLDTWKALSQAMGSQLRHDIRHTPVGGVIANLMAEQTELIQSLPTEAAQRVQHLTVQGLLGGRRSTEIAKEIAKSGEVAASRAKLIARTEVARTASNLTQARAMECGATHYVWETADDGAVRPGHAAMRGQVCSWAEPPAVNENGRVMHHHPGEIWNCFPGSTLVKLTPGIRKIIRTQFDGEIVDVRTPLADISATLNHPVMTQRGWVPVAKINEGDYLLQSLGDAIESSEPNEDVVHATFDDLFLALAKDHETASAAMFDFYGDVPDHDVDVGVVDRNLTTDLISQLRQAGGNFKFSGTDRIVGGTSLHAKHVGHPRAARQAASLLEREFLHSQDIRLAAGSNIDARLDESIDDRHTRYADSLRDGQYAFPGVVGIYGDAEVHREFVMWRALDSARAGVHASLAQFLAEHIRTDPNGGRGILDKLSVAHEGLRVVNLSRRKFSGHVYTLETDRGWYPVSTHNIKAKNCRCWAKIILPF